MNKWPASLLLCCLTLGAAEADPIKLQQADGTILELPGPATRIITLAPNLTELAFAAGAGERVIATVEYSDYPDTAQSIPRVGDAFRLDLERIVLYKPDLVVAWPSGNPGTAIDRLVNLGIKVWTVEIRKPEQIAEQLRAFGDATEQHDSADFAAVQLEGRLAALDHRYAGSQPLRYFYQVADRPLYTVNGEHLISQMLKKCGGINIFSAEPGLAEQVSHESVIVADPDALIAPRMTTEDHPLALWLDWPSMAAVNHSALIHVSADEISRATPRMVNAVESACEALNILRTRLRP
jgi:iron complex transport system substrate-binding protein